MLGCVASFLEPEAPAQALHSASKTMEPLNAQAVRLQSLALPMWTEEIHAGALDLAGKPVHLARCRKLSFYLELQVSLADRSPGKAAQRPAVNTKPAVSTLPHGGQEKWNYSDIDYLTLLEQTAPDGIGLGKGRFPG